MSDTWKSREVDMLKRIMELEAALEKSLTDCQDCMAKQDQRIAELEAENKALRKERDAKQWYPLQSTSKDQERIAELESVAAKAAIYKAKSKANIERLEMSIAELEAENELLRKDAERFRKIEANGLTISYRKKGIGVHKPMTNYPYELHKTLAGAVDATGD